MRSTYASILGCIEDDVVLGNWLFSNDEAERSAYVNAALQQAGESGTLFLDPDTGVRHSLWNQRNRKYARNQEYVTYDELTRLDDWREPHLDSLRRGVSSWFVESRCEGYEKQVDVSLSRGSDGIRLLWYFDEPCFSRKPCRWLPVREN